MTLNDAEPSIGRLLRHFSDFGILWLRELCGPITSTWLKLNPYCRQQKCSAKNLIFDVMRFIVIFSENTDREYVNQMYRTPTRKRKFDQHCTITGKRCEIGCMLVLFTNRKWHTGFRLVPKVNDLELRVRVIQQLSYCSFLCTVSSAIELRSYRLVEHVGKVELAEMA